MDQVFVMKRQIIAEEWHKRIQECQASGVPVTHWCKQNSICEQTYYKYLKRFRDVRIESFPLAVVPEKEKPVVSKKNGNSITYFRYQTGSSHSIAKCYS